MYEFIIEEIKDPITAYKLANELYEVLYTQIYHTSLLYFIKFSKSLGGVKILRGLTQLYGNVIIGKKRLDEYIRYDIEDKFHNIIIKERHKVTLVDYNFNNFINVKYTKNKDSEIITSKLVVVAVPPYDITKITFSPPLPW